MGNKSSASCFKGNIQRSNGSTQDLKAVLEADDREAVAVVYDVRAWQARWFKARRGPGCGSAFLGKQHGIQNKTPQTPNETSVKIDACVLAEPWHSLARTKGRHLSPQIRVVYG